MTLKKFHEFYRKVIEKQKKFQCEQLNVIKIDDPADSTSYMVCEEPPTFHIDVNEGLCFIFSFSFSVSYGINSIILIYSIA